MDSTTSLTATLVGEHDRNESSIEITEAFPIPSENYNDNDNDNINNAEIINTVPLTQHEEDERTTRNILRQSIESTFNIATSFDSEFEDQTDDDDVDSNGDSINFVEERRRVQEERILRRSLEDEFLRRSLEAVFNLGPTDGEGDTAQVEQKGLFQCDSFKLLLIFVSTISVLTIVLLIMTFRGNG